MMRNPYKREDIFLCRHESHRGFGHLVSAYHVLREKECFPEGCLDFRWKCQRLGKGGACPKGYKHVGNNCNHCRFYEEEKIQRLPELQVSEEQYRAFLEECRIFDEWLEDQQGRILEVGGTVSAVRPRLVREEDGRRSRLRLLGFLARLCPSFAGRQGFADPIFLRLSSGQQQRLRLAEGDRLEAEGELALDRGRLVVARPRRIHIEDRGGQAPLIWEQALLDRVGAVRLEGQPERCLHCERGVLVDVADLTGRQRGRRRELICLEGIGRPDGCPYEALETLRAGSGGLTHRGGDATCG
jgi:hypothetical protein